MQRKVTQLILWEWVHICYYNWGSLNLTKRILISFSFIFQYEVPIKLSPHWLQNHYSPPKCTHIRCPCLGATILRCGRKKGMWASVLDLSRQLPNELGSSNVTQTDPLSSLRSCEMEGGGHFLLAERALEWPEFSCQICWQSLWGELEVESNIQIRYFKSLLSPHLRLTFNYHLNNS